MMTNQLVLPKRNIGSYLKGCERRNVKTNLFKVEFSDKPLITIYSLSIDPEIPKDSSTKLKAIVDSDSARQRLHQEIGDYLVTGRTVYGCQAQKGKARDTLLKIEAELDKEKYCLVLKPVRLIDLAALKSSKQDETIMPLNFLNNLMKKFFASMNYVSIGKSGKYFNPASRKVLSNSQVLLFTGYETKFSIADTGLYLQVESMTRIVQSRTVLEEIDKIYSKNSNLSKDEKREALKKELIGRPVMANYGKSRIWAIKDIVFDFDFENNKVGKDSNMNFIEYYQKSYGLKLTKLKQPVLRAVMNGTKPSKEATECLLIPEFLLLSGLPDDVDQRKRRDISEFTNINPDEKLARIESLIDNFNQGSQNFSPNLVSQSIGVKISHITETVQAIMLPPPFLQLGKNQSVDKNKVANFQLFNKEIYSHDVTVSIVVLIPNDYDFMPIDKLFASTCKSLCIKNIINLVKINYKDSKKAMADIQKYVEDAEGKFDDYDLNWFILPPNMKSAYKNIKRWSLKPENPKVTQVTLTSTLAKKGFASILTKILLQIASKVGNVPWAPRVPASVPQRTMLVGIDSCKVGSNKVVGYCCTINKEMTKFHSSYHYQPVVTTNFSAKMGDLIADCITAYSKNNSAMPEEIIIIKADISDGEKYGVVSAEISQMKEKLKSMSGYTPKFTFMTANKNSKQKFFNQGRTASNPSYGTLINSKIVSKSYDFFLIAQHCNRGTVKPVHYKVLYTDSKMEEGVLQELIYCQSFNYMNWSGSVRVPSVLQYSTKLCSFVGEYISSEAGTTQLNQLLYYI